MSLLYPFSHSMHVYGHNGMWGYGYGIIGDMLMFILWILVIGAIVYFVMRHHGTVGQCMPGTKSGNSALDILKERYAKGEINKEEFEEKKKDLQ